MSAFQASLGECHGVQDQVIRRGHDQGGIGIQLLKFEGDIGDTGSGVFAGEALREYVAFREQGQLFGSTMPAYSWEVTHIDILHRDKGEAESLMGPLDLGLPGVEDVHANCFGEILSAHVGQKRLPIPPAK